MNDNENNSDSREKKNINWFENILLGLVMFFAGLMISFFPKIISSVSFMIIGIIFLIVGITDAIASIRYKDSTGGWKSGLISGIAALAVSAFFLLTYYIPAITNKISTNISLIVISAWCVLRCIVTLLGVLTGKIKRKGVVLPAFITGLAGVLLFVFRQNWAVIQRYAGYALLAAGIVMIFIGFMQRADKREKIEKTEREQLAAEEIEKANNKSVKLLDKLKKNKDSQKPDDPVPAAVENTEETNDEDKTNEAKSSKRHKAGQ